MEEKDIIGPICGEGRYLWGHTCCPNDWEKQTLPDSTRSCCPKGKKVFQSEWGEQICCDENDSVTYDKTTSKHSCHKN